MEKILVIKLGALGDFIQAFGPMQAIRHHHKKSHITLLTTKPFENLAKASGYFDEVWIDERPRFFQFAKIRTLGKKLNSAGFFRVYDLQNNDRTGFYFKLFSVKPQWVGIAKSASHRNTSPLRTAGLAFYGHVQTLALAGIKDVSVDRLEWMKGDIGKFHLQKPYVLIVPGSAPDRLEKRWPVENFIKVCQFLLQKNMTPVLIGTQAEKDITAAIAKSCPAALDLTGRTALTDIPELARHADFCIGNDTGPMHMVAPTGTKTIVLFSGTSNPIRHSPLGENVKTFQELSLKNLNPDTITTYITQNL